MISLPKHVSLPKSDSGDHFQDSGPSPSDLDDLAAYLDTLRHGDIFPDKLPELDEDELPTDDDAIWWAERLGCSDEDAPDWHAMLTVSALAFHLPMMEGDDPDCLGQDFDG